MEKMSDTHPRKMTRKVSTLLVEGNARMDLHMPEEAIPFYQQVMEKDPQNTEALQGLGLASLLVKEYSKALQCFEHAIKLAPNDPVNWINIAKVFVKEKRYQEAFNSFNTALDKNPSNPAAIWNEIGLTSLECGSNEEAIVFFDQALGINPQLLESLAGKGLALCKEGRLKEAIVCYDQVLEVDPLYPKARIYRAIALKRMEEYGGSSQRQMRDFE